MRIPLLVRWPTYIKPGSKSDLLCYFPDIMPTLAELAGASSHLPPDIDGISIAPTLLGSPERQRKHDFLYWEYPRGKGLQQAMRMRNWKLIKTPKGRIELYDLAEDTGETKDVAGEHPDVVKKIEAILAAEHTPGRKYAPIKRPTIHDFVH